MFENTLPQPECVQKKILKSVFSECSLSALTWITQYVFWFGVCPTYPISLNGSKSFSFMIRQSCRQPTLCLLQSICQIFSSGSYLTSIKSCFGCYSELLTSTGVLAYVEKVDVALDSCCAVTFKSGFGCSFQKEPWFSCFMFSRWTSLRMSTLPLRFVRGDFKLFEKTNVWNIDFSSSF